jgi:uncharacterized damage-inducible protein DinB
LFAQENSYAQLMESEKLLKHMAWANSEILAKVALMPDEALDTFSTDSEWTAKEIINHIVTSAYFYGLRLQTETMEDLARVEKLRGEALSKELILEKTSELQPFIDSLKTSDAVLLQESYKPEGLVLREIEGKLIKRARSTIIFQSVHHATEHRTQLVDALNSGAFTGINLDDYDLWAYVDKFGE